MLSTLQGLCTLRWSLQTMAEGTKDKLARIESHVGTTKRANNYTQYKVLVPAARSIESSVRPRFESYRVEHTIPADHERFPFGLPTAVCGQYESDLSESSCYGIALATSSF